MGLLSKAFDTVTANSLSTGSATIDGDPALAGPQSTSEISPGFGVWTTADADNPTLIFADVRAQTDGTNNGIVDVKKDNSGGTTEDVSQRIFADSGLGSGGSVFDRAVMYLPAGGQFIVENSSDPAANNTLFGVEVVVL